MSAVVIGDALIDEIVTRESTSEFVGGAALNVAVGLSILGVPTSLVAMVGDDEDGEVIREFLRVHGITLIATHAPLGSARASSVRTAGEPSYSFNAAARARRIEFGPEAHAAIDAARLVVVSCFPFDDPAQAEALRQSVSRPAERLVLDVNPRQGLMRDIAVFRREFEATALESLLVKVGDEDAELLYQEDPTVVARRLLASGARNVFTTLGAEGAVLRTTDGVVVARPITALPEEIVDTMGAGDATLASIVASILSHPTKPTAEQWGVALDRAMLLAAATCRVPGATLQLAD